MKQTFLIELSVLTALVVLCIFRTLQSRKKIRGSVFFVLSAIVIPLLGNIIIASSESPVVCNTGYMLFLMGTNLVLFTLIDFSFQYCAFTSVNRRVMAVVAVVLAADSLSVFLNNLFMHCYTLEETVLESGEIYYVLKSGLGHYIHLAISAVLIFMIVGNFMWKIVTTARLYLERYLVILLSVILVGLWEYRIVLLDRTIDRSMLGLAIGGILLYFFAIEYRPIFLMTALHELLVANMTDAVLFFDVDGRAIYANKAASEMFGITKATLSSSAALLGDEITGSEFVENGSRVDHDFRRQVEIKNGEETRYYDVTCQRMEDRRGNYLGTFFGIGDNTQMERERRESLYRQTHDLLTGMLNRETFIDRVNHILADEPDESYVMLLSDIADFKIINDIYGRERADGILQGIANAIRRTAHEDTVYCRWGGDQFAALVRKKNIDPEELEKKIHAGLKRGNEDNVIKFPVVIHAGYYAIQDRSLSVSAIVDRCRLAIAMVHDDYQRCVGVYDDKLRQERLWEQRINAELPGALSSGQIFPYLQPQYNSRNELTGAEVLVRWQHPSEGFLAPYRFIPIFEKNGMIAKVDLYIWEEACRILASWKGTERDALHLSVNISPKDFYFVDIYETFTSLAERFGLDPKKLHLEITETVVMNDAVENINTINRLREYGFIVEMDDFGSGYSSLNMLRDMPVDVLKIDMAFLGKTSQPKKAELILNNIIDLAHQLNMLSIAEGVEMENQLEMLKQMGCNVFQGYYFAKPMPLEDFEKLAA